MASVPLRTSADTPEKVAEMMSRLEESGSDLAIIRAVANAETAFTSFVRYAAALMRRLDVPARTRELIIMRCAATQSSSYEWAEHYVVALDAEVTREELEALGSGQVPRSVTEEECLYLSAADEILSWLDGEERSGDAMEELRAEVDDRQFTEFSLIMGWWAGCVPIIIECLGLDPDRPEVPGED